MCPCRGHSPIMSGILPALAPREPAPQVDAATAGTRGHGIAQRGRAWVPRHRSQGAQWGRSACRVGWRGRKGKGCRGGGGEHRGERWRRRQSTESSSSSSSGQSPSPPDE
ncbi:hypothetical protein SORBI_3004G159866 [Sorghum bicolor]|uniref:Uncharacterized protein n=1 Tax=Sorghum bicolor TaxID=4558 RepID=A0A1Z5RN49_SORBI|nr:hypothetical protein SORBI_3004G159866 [Sorghum bicolor]